MFTLETQKLSMHKISFSKQSGLSLGHEIRKASMAQSQECGQKLYLESLIMEIALCLAVMSCPERV